MFKKYTSSQRVTIIGAIVNLLNALVKLIAGVMLSSYVLIADGLHSLSDLFSDVMVFISTSIGRIGPDQNHPYGHGRFETLGALVLGGLLLAMGGGLIWDSLVRLLGESKTNIFRYEVVLIAVCSLLSKEWIYFYTKKIAREERSNLLAANAWHHRVDSLSTLIVLLAALGLYLGLYWIEFFSGFLIGLLIIYVGISASRESLAELVDTAPIGLELSKEIKEFIEKQEGVLKLISLRSRQSGPDIWLEIHLAVDGQKTVIEGENIGDQVSKNIKNQYQSINYVTFIISGQGPN